MTSSKSINTLIADVERATIRSEVTASERPARDRMRRLMAAYRRVERIFQSGEPMAAAVAVFALACALPVWAVLGFGAAVVDALWRWQ
jgi:hypothetical protein